MSLSRQLRRAARSLTPQQARRQAIAFASLPAIVREMDEPGRCHCPQCLMLDAMHPGEGYQLALFPYVTAVWAGKGSRP